MQGTASGRARAAAMSGTAVAAICAIASMDSRSIWATAALCCFALGLPGQCYYLVAAGEGQAFLTEAQSSLGRLVRGLIVVLADVFVVTGVVFLLLHLSGTAAIAFAGITSVCLVLYVRSWRTR